MKNKKTSPRAPTLLVMGPQGSGKGTQAALLAKKYHFLHVEMGEILRSLSRRKKQTAFTRAVNRTINQGWLVPSSWVVRLLGERLRSVSPRRGVVLDGSARRLPETRALPKTLARTGRVLDGVFLIDIPRAESLRRLSRRWVCTEHHHILIMGKDVRKPSHHCPRCGSPIEQREDDTPRAIAKRLAQYWKETAPVVKLFERQRLLYRINGKRPIRAVFRDIDRIYKTIRP